jgi:uncharacterized protein DUF5916
MRTGRLQIVAVACMALAPRAAWPEAPRQVQALRVAEGAIRLDGGLDEEAWRNAAPATGFRQRDPDEGKPARDVVEVRFAYDADALYVGARVRTDGGRAVQAPLGRRDDGAQSEHVIVSLDTYHDRRTAYSFGVTAAGVRLDQHHFIDVQADPDTGYDPVWEARTARAADGWTAEMRIPFTQLRFNAAAQAWGLNIVHWVPSRNEETYWVLVGKKEAGWASRFGELAGIEGIRPTRRIELLPYATSGSTLTGDRDRRNPFDDGLNLEGRVGGDVKMGIGPNLTLEATMNPDFGQVEGDPADINLSAFETIFTERRPFFTEGSQLLRGRGANYFYSRRIGAAPRAPAEGDFVDYPRTASILGAAKLTGRLPSGVSLGALAAVTDRESARVFDLETGALGSVPVAARTAYGILRAQQEFGAARSTVGLTLTGVRRALDAADPLASFLGRAAAAGGVDWNLRFDGGTYEVSGYAGFSHLTGEPAAITQVQTSSAHYFQRPDLTYVRFDPARRALTGSVASGSVSKQGGKHWLWTVGGGQESPSFETNDAGRLGSADGRFGYFSLRYRETQPGRVFRSWSASVAPYYEWNFGGDRQVANTQADVALTWLNYWRTKLTYGRNAASQDERLTRGGPSMGVGDSRYWIAHLLGPAAGRTQWNAQVYFESSDDGFRSVALSGGLSFRPGPRFQLSLDPAWERRTDPRQYVAALPGGPAATFGQRYVFAFIDRTTVSAQLRASYTFKPDLSLDVYAEPFTASGRFYDHGELAAARNRVVLVYGRETGSVERQPDGSRLVTANGEPFVLANDDFNVRSFRSNVVLRWEWRLGSTLYAVWQQDRFASEPLGDRVGAGDLLRSVGARGDNILALKASFWVGLR